MDLLLTLLLAASTPAGEALRLPPVDECASQPGFTEFRTALRDAVARKDPHALLALVDKDIDISFGDSEGQGDFARSWKLDDPGKSEIWAELTTVLDLGCATDGTVAMAPSFINKLPNDHDVFETMVPTAPAVPLYAAAGGGEPIATLEWDVLQTPEWDGLTEWVPVTLADGRNGFVERRHLRSPVDYRAFFEQVDGAWKMTVFIAGD